ncbi:MAG: DUF87 domain-containing protein [Candidatus Lokiarchaeota archaeon]|nr:DUF87 domain-containing protein [Candidatus Lokiarchaeota archaeon]
MNSEVENDDEEKLIGVVIGSSSGRNVYGALKSPYETSRGSFVRIEHQEKDKYNFVSVIAKVSEIERKSDLFTNDFPSEYLNRVISTIPQNYHEKTIVNLEVIGYADEKSHQIKIPRRPIKPGAKIYLIEQSDLKYFFKQNLKNSITIGRLVGYEKSKNSIPVNLSISELITQHLVVLAMTGAGKSYTLGRICEHITGLFNGSVLILDPHGEYGNMFMDGELRFDESSLEDDIYSSERKDIKTNFKSLIEKGAGFKVVAPNNDFSRLKYGTDNFIPLIINFDELNLTDIIELLPGMSEPQRRTLRVAWKQWRKDTPPRNPLDLIDLLTTDFDKVQQRVKREIGEGGRAISRTSARIIGLRLKNFIDEVPIFYVPDVTPSPISIENLVGRKDPRSVEDQLGRITVLDFQSIPKEILQISTTIVLKKILLSAKEKRTRSCFIVIEEGHNFAPSKKNIASKRIISQIASEGRKFGVGLGIVSQRPNKLDPDVVSQCNSFITLRIKNPDDQNFVRKVGEYLSQRDLQELPGLSVGEALIFGRAITTPMLTKIGPRHLEHGGETPDVISIWRKQPLEEE